MQIFFKIYWNFFIQKFYLWYLLLCIIKALLVLQEISLRWKVVLIYDPHSLPPIIEASPLKMFYWWSLLLCVIKAFLVLKYISLCWSVVLVIQMFMLCKGISGPESFLAQIAGNRDSLQMLCFNVILHISLLCLFSTQCAFI